MLVIRMQRKGRKGHAMFRMVVQESRLTPTSGKVVAQLGSYDPHSKAITLNKEKVAFYLEHGAQPSERVTRLIKKEGVKLPGWVNTPDSKKRVVRNAEKRRSTAPEKPKEEPAVEAPVEPDEAVETEKPEAAEPEAPAAEEQIEESAVAEEAKETSAEDTKAV